MTTQPSRIASIGVEGSVSRTAPVDLWRTALLLLGAIVIAFAGLVGGMQFIVIGIALALALLVMREPRETVSAGWLFMLAAMTLLPSEARLRFIDDRFAQSWQMYYWAAGSLAIMLAAVVKLGFSSLWRTPWSLKAFLLVAVVSSVFGFNSGNELSYVLRQLYGSILFALYFAIACVAGDEELIFRRLKTFGVLLAFAFFIYYAAMFSEFGFHKEDTSLPIQMGMFATLLFVKGYLERRWEWVVPAGVLLAACLLLFYRHIILTFLFAAVVAMALKSGSSLRKLVFYTIAVLILLPSIFPFGAQFVLDTLETKAPKTFDMLPQGTASAATLMSRNLELALGASAIIKSPVLGEGMGSDLAWEDPARGSVDQAFVDNGWAYVMIKMGGAGVITFIWLLFTILRCMSRESAAISISLLAILAITMFSEPVCFQYTMSPIAGGLAGLLYSRKYPLNLKEPA